ncbi:MAG: methyltransferase domain-containing protein [Herminiimonas sp.]|nr:methyltransferase domain-containing protein [Herminiimonas sp.]
MVSSPLHAADLQASAWVQRFAPLVGPGEVLDLACGHGRHALLFAALGHDVLAVDRDGAVLAQLAERGNAHVQTVLIDLENDAAPGPSWPFVPQRFAGIVVTNYLHRRLLPLIVASLAPGGVLIYETFARGNERFGKPSNPDFLLVSGELLQLVAAATSPLRVVAFEEGVLEQPAAAMVQRICAVRPSMAGTTEILPRI